MGKNDKSDNNGKNGILKRLTREVERCEKDVAKDEREISKVNESITRSQSNLENLALELKYHQERLAAARKALEDAQKDASGAEGGPPAPSL